MTDQIVLNPTEPLDAKRHERDNFFSGVTALDNYLKRQARKEAEQNLSQTFVLTSKGKPQQILGYYSLSANNIDVHDLPKDLTKKLPRYGTIGMTLLGRFAISESHQNKGLRLGEHLLIDAKLKAWRASRVVASFGMIIDVLAAEKGNPSGFYKKYGFVPFSDQPNRLYLPMLTIGQTLSAYGLIEP